MMKKSIFTLVLLAVTGWLSAQTLQFELNDHVYAQGETIICTNITSWGELLQEMYVRNITDGDLDVMVEKEYVQIVEGTVNTFCWGNCFDQSVFVSPRPITVEAGTASGEGMLSFHHLIDPDYTGDPNNFIAGTSIVKYYAYPENDPENKICIEVWFAYNAESVTETPSVSFGHAYPNPTSSTVRFDYRFSGSENASVAIYNLLGQEVMRQQLNNMQGVVSFSVDDLQEGIYFCNLFINGQSMKTEKFVVKK